MRIKQELLLRISMVEEQLASLEERIEELEKPKKKKGTTKK